MEPTATEKKTETIATQQVHPEDDAASKIAKLEVEKENYRKAYLKASQKGDSETEDDKIQRIVDERIAESALAKLDKEKDEIIANALKENRELKLAQLNKTGAPPAAIGTHSESPSVQDTLVTPEQLNYFKAMKWDDKKIEAYKRNYLKKR